MKNNKLDLNDLENVSGGAIFNASNISGADKNNPIELINAKGDTMKRFSDMNEAIKYAKDNGYSTQQLTWDEVCSRRQDATKG
ncbi:MAG: hypothetical protein K6F99_00135 [Lachnospiraceae bacterium]|nr:hypothetical protein [Lachnospiraceae bacterium]